VFSGWVIESITPLGGALSLSFLEEGIKSSFREYEIGQAEELIIRF
jgi:hypothetical protein